MPARKIFLSCCALLALLAACSNDSPAQENGTYTFTSPNRDGIGKFYMGREISHVMGHRGADWLERPERITEERTDLAMSKLPLKKGDSVADIGAGSGYFTFPMSEIVGDTGAVFAVDIQPEMLAIIEKRANDLNVQNITSVQATAKDPGLKPESIDMALFVDVYHELEWPLEVMTALLAAIKPGGKVVLLEYRKEDPWVPIARLHKMSEQQVRMEMEALGLKFLSNEDFLPRQHFLIFEKPAAQSP